MHFVFEICFRCLLFQDQMPKLFRGWTNPLFKTFGNIFIIMVSNSFTLLYLFSVQLPYFYILIQYYSECGCTMIFSEKRIFFLPWSKIFWLANELSNFQVVFSTYWYFNICKHILCSSYTLQSCYGFKSLLESA